MNRNEAIFELIKILAKVSFKNGIIDAKTGQDSGELTQRRFIHMLKNVIYEKNGGIIYKMRPASEFFADFTAKTKDKTEPGDFVIAMMETIVDIQNSALDSAKHCVPELFHDRLEELKEFNLKEPEKTN